MAKEVSTENIKYDIDEHRISGQKAEFVDNVLVKGMSKKDAAIAAGVSPRNASVYATRWWYSEEVQNYIEVMFRLDVSSHREKAWLAINAMSTIAGDSKNSAKTRLEAAKALLQVYEHTIVNEMVTKNAENTTIETLEQRLRNPVPVRTIEDFEKDI